MGFCQFNEEVGWLASQDLISCSNLPGTSNTSPLSPAPLSCLIGILRQVLPCQVHPVANHVSEQARVCRDWVHHNCRISLYGLITSEKIVISNNLTTSEFSPWENTRVIKRIDAYKEIAAIK
jgi:xanthosine utilization system XapX-like protein